MKDSIIILKEKLAGDEVAEAALEALDMELCEAALCEARRLCLEAELEEAHRSAAAAKCEAADAGRELEKLSEELEAVRRDAEQARLRGELALEAAKCGCRHPWDLLNLAGCEGVGFDEEGGITGVAGWLERAKNERPWMFENMRRPALYRAATAGNGNENGIEGALAAAARRYDGQ